MNNDSNDLYFYTLNDNVPLMCNDNFNCEDAILMLQKKEDITNFQNSNEYQNVQIIILYHSFEYLMNPKHFYFTDIKNAFLFCEKNFKQYGLNITTYDTFNNFKFQEIKTCKSLFQNKNGCAYLYLKNSYDSIFNKNYFKI